jgi:hypothetical protein
VEIGQYPLLGVSMFGYLVLVACSLFLSVTHTHTLYTLHN